MRLFAAFRTQIIFALGVIAAAFTPTATQAWSLSTLHSFCSELSGKWCRDGLTPSGTLAADAAGNLYGTTIEGGRKHGQGTVFELMRQNDGSFAYALVYEFCPHGKDRICPMGDYPNGGLVVDTHGNLYGTAWGGANGRRVAFELSPSNGQWSFQILYNFCSKGGDSCTDGDSPESLTYRGASTGALYDGKAPLYGATAYGGAHRDDGTVFQLKHRNGIWTQKVLHSFCCDDGLNPESIVFDGAGNLFGTAQDGGGQNAGLIFQLSPAEKGWNESVLYRFCQQPQCADGDSPGPLTVDADGILYGATGAGGFQCNIDGRTTCGTVFKLVPDGAQSQYQVLYQFCQQPDCVDGLLPAGALTVDAAGHLFGMTSEGGGHNGDDQELGGGTVFELTGSSFETLYAFCTGGSSCPDGEYPISAPFLDRSGNIYGATFYGGAHGRGTMFELSP
ncbi:MAG TPA: choice-of-anchor tandem repeat GloVer-containing protein [Rhizomicrobium sp.]|jgi:uncharacterized repeat protein (TIGR03803 family)|nr:choice-of-anchor tandem repeat GloVer-containing protein [Rhizomicrobium sp.]